MKLVQFYLSTIIIAIKHPQTSGSGFLTPDELEYLSERLYPAECSYLTTALYQSLTLNSKSLKQNSADDISVNRPQLHCLVKLEEWNEMVVDYEKAHDSMEKILHEIGRFDLARFLSEKLYSTDKLCSKEDIVLE